MRGKILRDTNAGDGIIHINNEQKPFTLEKNWRSSTPPKVGGIVEVELNESGNIVSLQAVDDAAIAKEQAQKALELASAQGKAWFGVLLTKVGIPTLVSIVVLACAWLLLSTVNVQISAGQKESVTFYQILKVVNTSAGLDGIGGLRYASAGVYGFFLFIALLAPLFSHFHANKFLKLGYFAPLAFMLIIGASVYMSIRDGVEQARGLAGSFGGSQGAAMAESMMSEMMSMTMRAISLGMGFYLALAIAGYLALVGVKKYLVSTATV
jgi:hypothetical protein